MLTQDNTIFVLIDVQGKLAKMMYDSDQLLKNIHILIQGAKQLNIPIIWLEQYPEGLGATIPELMQQLTEEEPIDKKVFSGYQRKAFQEKMEQGRNNFILMGIEAHICVYQTAKDLLANSKHVEIVVDAISSRTNQNKHIAIDKMVSLGAKKTSVEMILFELLHTAEHPSFKEISKLIK